MSQYAGPGATRASGYEQPTGWVGWIMFAALMMVMLGCFHAIQGLVAIFDDQKFAVTDSGLLVSVDYTAWGWTHLIGGIILALAGASMFAGRMWARIVRDRFGATIRHRCHRGAPCHARTHAAGSAPPSGRPGPAGVPPSGPSRIRAS